MFIIDLSADCFLNESIVWSMKCKQTGAEAQDDIFKLLVLYKSSYTKYTTSLL